MARCDSCGALIVFGGESWNGMRFCCEHCVQTAFKAASYAEEIPDDVVLERAMELRNGRCPRCGGDGPNDFHIAWSVYSLLIVTHHSRKEMFGCKWCGIKHKIKYLTVTGLFGWWGIPWGILMTPYFLYTNLMALFRGVPVRPSDELKQFAVSQIVEELRRHAEALDHQADVETVHRPDYL